VELRAVLAAEPIRIAIARKVLVRVWMRIEVGEIGVQVAGMRRSPRVVGGAFGFASGRPLGWLVHAPHR
jgi:hypothetical protein